MNFPVGDVISKSYLPISFEKISLELQKIRFNGYIIQTVESSSIEEGALFFREGEFYACVVECMAREKIFKGDSAIPFFLNQTRAKGFFHTIQLTRSQVDLVTAFDEKLLLKNKLPLKNLPKIIPLEFEDKFAENNSEEDVLEKYGLSSLKK
jgi:hypothetical protein